MYIYFYIEVCHEQGYSSSKTSRVVKVPFVFHFGDHKQALVVLRNLGCDT